MAAVEKPQTLDVFASRKKAGQKISMLTAYDFPSAAIAADGGVDAILVGDSLGMVVLGYRDTLPVTLEEMTHHCAAVMRAQPGVPVIADLPYGSFHVSSTETVRQAVALIKQTGVNAVKLEGGRVREDVIAALQAAEIPVMGHLGLTPQSVNRMGGFKVQGRGLAAAAKLEDDAKFLAEAGCFAVVLECVPAALATRISHSISIPTIGIGAGAGCDGQVLVFHDLLGLYDGVKPRFVKRYAGLGSLARQAVKEYVGEVRDGIFPAAEHTFSDSGSGPKSGTVSPEAQPSKNQGYLGKVDEAED